METKMKNKKKEKKAYSIKQALIGLELGETDKSLLKYFNFFAKLQPVEAVYCLNVVPKFDLERALYERETQSLIKDYTLNSDAINRMEIEVIPILTAVDDSKVEYKVKEGDPLEALLDTSKNRGVDLLVIGNGKGFENHGILAKNLVRNTTVNTLVVPNDAKQELINILVPVDFSASSIKALQTSVAIQKNLDSNTTITALHIYSMPSLNHFREDPEWTVVQERVEASLRKAFSAFLHTNLKEDIDLVNFHCIERAHPGTAQFIYNYAIQNDISLMITGAKGHSKVHHLLMGSVTEELIDRSDHIPIMIVR